MSEVPHSPPETPFKNAPALGYLENMSTRGILDEISTSGEEDAINEHLTDADAGIDQEGTQIKQLPSSQNPPVKRPSTPQGFKPQQNGVSREHYTQNGNTRESTQKSWKLTQLSSRNPTQKATQKTNGIQSQGQTGGTFDDDDSDKDLPPFDYANIEEKYNAMLEDINNEENELYNQFLKCSDLFDLWSKSAALRDHDRAVKRLKTRERYVQLSEEALEKKQKHHTNVIKAFQTALDLLSSST